MNKTLIINRKLCEQLLNYPLCIEAMKEVFSEVSLGSAKQLQRGMIGHESNNTLAIMPASLGDKQITGSKIIIFPSKETAKNGTNQGIVPIFDTENGALISIVDAELITVLRTASASACATDFLAKKEAQTLAILGGGKQGKAHALAISKVRNLKEIYVWSRTLETCEDFKGYISEKLPNISVIICNSPQKAVENADIICTTTSGKAEEPILKGEWVKKGSHINAIGACSAKSRELDSNCVKNSRIFVDWKEAALRDGGDLAIPIEKGELKAEEIVGELGEVILGRLTARENSEDITLFKSVGISAQDLAAAYAIYKKAREEGVGVELEI